MTKKRTNAELALYVVEWIKAQHIAVPPNSRLGKMRAMFVSPDGTPMPFIAPDHPDFQIALEGIRDFQILGFVFDQFEVAPPSRVFKDRLRTILGDTPLPQDNLQGTQGRDAA